MLAHFLANRGRFFWGVRGSTPAVSHSPAQETFNTLDGNSPALRTLAAGLLLSDARCDHWGL